MFLGAGTPLSQGQEGGIPASPEFWNHLHARTQQETLVELLKRPEL